MRTVGTHESTATRSRDPHWQVLFSGKARMLVVPSHNQRAQRRSVEFFVDSPLRRLWAGVLLEVNRLWPGAPLLPPLPVPAVPSAIDAKPTMHTAFQIGTPGPYQKASLLIMGDDGTPVALSKVALKETADAMVDNEARWLRELNRYPSLSGCVPRLLAHGSARGGRRYVLLSVAEGRGGSKAFTPAHAAFLAALSQIGQRRQRFVESLARHYMTDMLARLRPNLPAAVASVIDGGLSDCDERLREWKGPFVLAHGDFVPWNTRRDRGRIVVFDWEYAEEGALPVRDVGHFLLLPRVLARRGVGTAQMHTIIEQVGIIARRMHPQTDWPRAVVAALMLGYLLHTVLFYAGSRGGLRNDDVVVGTYRRLIEERAQWVD